MTVERIGVSLEGPLLTEFDRFVTHEGYGSRSEALRNLIREALTRRRWSGGGRVVGTITIVYRHEVGMVTHRLLHRQHEFLRFIRATAHTHLDDETCLEVLIVNGEARKIGELANRLKTVKGVLSAETVIGSTKVR
jgi:CopG family nickel-responsive transcriptional regulator